MSKKLLSDVEHRDYSREVINHISNGWSKSSQVMKFDNDINSIIFQPDIPDFIPELIPFYESNLWEGLTDEERMILLSSGWVIYQSNTIYIETDLVTPACIDVIRSRQDAIVRPEIARSMSEAMTDEGYHTLLAVITCEAVREKRQLPIFPKNFHLVKVMNQHISNYDAEWKRRVARIATACCTENHITDYLDILTGKENMQPMFINAVVAHAKDEWNHGSQFSVLAKELFLHLSQEGRVIFKDTISTVADNFFRADVDAWTSAISPFQNEGIVRIREKLEKDKKTIHLTREYTNNNRGLRKLYDVLEWDWDRDRDN